MIDGQRKPGIVPSLFHQHHSHPDKSHISSVVCLGEMLLEAGNCVPHVKCAAGKFTAIPGNSTSQPTCEPCRSGYYKAAMSTTSIQTDECDAHATCSAGEYTEIAGNTTDDTQCLPVVSDPSSAPGVVAVPILAIVVPTSVVVLVAAIGVAAFIWCRYVKIIRC